MSIGGIAAGAGLAAGVGDVKDTTGRNPNGELTSNLQALLGMAPQLFGGEQSFQPQYTGLNQSNLRQTLMGSDGLIQLLSAMQPGLNRVTSGQRASLVNDLSTLGPGVTAAWRNSNPGLANLTDSINRTATDQLNAGSTLGPDLSRTLANSYRGAQAARGLGTGRGDAGLEAYFTAQQGQNLLNNRMQMAQQAAGTSAGIMPNAFGLLSNIMGPDPGSVVQQGYNANQQAGPRLFDPLNNYFGQAYGGNYAGQLNSNITSANNASALIRGGISSQSSGSGMSMLSAI